MNKSAWVIPRSSEAIHSCYRVIYLPLASFRRPRWPASMCSLSLPNRHVDNAVPLHYAVAMERCTYVFCSFVVLLSFAVVVAVAVGVLGVLLVWLFCCWIPCLLQIRFWRESVLFCTITSAMLIVEHFEHMWMVKL